MFSFPPSVSTPKASLAAAGRTSSCYQLPFWLGCKHYKRSLRTASAVNCIYAYILVPRSARKGPVYSFWSSVVRWTACDVAHECRGLPLRSDPAICCSSRTRKVLGAGLSVVDRGGAEIGTRGAACCRSSCRSRVWTSTNCIRSKLHS